MGMKVVGDEVLKARQRCLLEELKGLFGPAFGPALEIYGRSFAEGIGQDESFRAEVRDRFERGRALGGFPKLSALLSGMTPEEQEEFFEGGWTRVALPPPGHPSTPGSVLHGPATVRATARTSTRGSLSPSRTCAPSRASGSRSSQE